MDIRVINFRDSDSLSDTRVVPFYEGVDLSEDLEYLGSGIEAMISHLVRDEKFTGKYGEIESFRIPREKNPKNIILAGLGTEDDLTCERVRKLVSKIIKESKKLDAKSIKLFPIHLRPDFPVGDFSRAVAESALMTDYSFEKYKSKKKESSIKELNIIYRDDENVENLNIGIIEGMILGESTVLARNLTNEPPNFMTPQAMAKAAMDAGEECGFDVEVLDEDRMRKLGMDALLSVSAASESPAQFIIMRYFGNRKNKDDILGFVGKGITFDSGGLCVKPPSAMPEMKSDMAGGASVIGAISAIAKLGLSINVVGVIAACENAISGNAYRPSDIIGSMSGKTIEVLNTDAEGRLTLADAVYYTATKEKATRIIDVATLTGAVLIALGTTTTAAISNNDDFYSILEQASTVSGEKLWRLPANDEYRDLLKSEIADMKNSCGKNAGAITAGLFMEPFVQDLPWIHLDIAGTSWAEKASDYTSKGGTGVGVRTLYHAAKLLSFKS